MCGIYGVLGLSGEPRHGVGLLRRMGDSIVHRGPDDQGVFEDGAFLMGMRRLSIIDVAGGHQPITSEDGGVVVVCNGEIYNFRELRVELQGKGHLFATNSDTEVIAHAYEEYGDEFLGKLEGMFGLALWDRRRRRLLVARDALGIKPIYYRLADGQLAFASEAKAILRIPGVAAELDPASLAQYLAVGYVSTPNSLFAGLRKLPPGSVMEVENGRVTVRQFWQLPDGLDRTRSEQDWVDELRAELERSVRAQMVSDVPIGAFLSGGLDSSTVVAFMARYVDEPVRTYSIGFKGSSGAELFNELPHARQVAQAFGTTHREILVQPDVAALLPELLWHMDEPISDAAFITTYLVSKFARQDVTVILSGVGGDELFGGYRRYLDEHYRGLYRRMPKLLRRALVDPVARRLPSDRHSWLLNELRLVKSFVLADSLPFDDRYRQYMEVFDATQRAAMMLDPAQGFDDCIERAFGESHADDPLRRLMDVDLSTQLPDDLLMLTDKMSMAVSLECRVPLLDQRLVDLAARIPGESKLRGGNLKHLMKRAMRGILPDAIIDREKRGFGAPVGAWFRQELAPLVRFLLSRESIIRRGLLDPEAVARTVDEHDRRHADRTDHLLALVNLEIWCRLFLDGTRVEDLTGELKSRLQA